MRGFSDSRMLTYRVETVSWRVIFFKITHIIFKFCVEHLSCCREWPWRQRLHVEEGIWSPPLEHLYSRIEWSYRSGRLSLSIYHFLFSTLHGYLPCCWRHMMSKVRETTKMESTLGITFSRCRQREFYDTVDSRKCMKRLRGKEIRMVKEEGISMPGAYFSISIARGTWSR